MRNLVVAAAVLFAAFPAPQRSSAQAAPAPQTSQSVVVTQPADPDVPAKDAGAVMDARLYMARKLYDEAAKIYLKLARENPHNASYLNMAGIAMMQQADLQNALNLFEHATKVDKNFADAYSNLGTIWLSQRDYRKAIRYYQKALMLEPGIAALYTNMGIAYLNDKRPEDAMNMFHQALAIDPDIFDTAGANGPILQDRTVGDRGLFFFTMAKSYAQVGDAKHCAEYLRKANDEMYKDMAKARSDPAFTQVLADPDVQAVLDIAAPLPPAQGDAPAPVPAPPPKT